MLPSSTNNAFATSEIEIFTLPIPVQISTDITDIFSCFCKKLRYRAAGAVKLFCIRMTE